MAQPFLNPLNKAAQVLQRRAQPTPESTPAAEPTKDELARLLIERAATKMAQEMPSEMEGTTIEPMGFSEKIVPWAINKFSNAGRTVASATSPTRISYDPAVVAEQTPQDVEGYLTHELTHINQLRRPNKRGFMEDLFWRLDRNLRGPSSFNEQTTPEEIEAYQAQRSREHRGRKYYLLTEPLQKRKAVLDKLQ